MKEFVFISGKQNAGKTTTAWCVYQRLLPYSTNTVMYIRGARVINHGEIVYKEPPYDKQPDDFKVFLELPGYKAAIISGGDNPKLLEKEIESTIAENTDFIVIALRSINRTGSSRRMIQDVYPEAYTREFFSTEYDSTLTNQLDVVNSKRRVADRIANYILLQTTYSEFK